MEKISSYNDINISEISALRRQQIEPHQINFGDLKIRIEMPEEVIPHFLYRYSSVLPQLAVVDSNKDYNVLIHAQFGEPFLKIDNNLVQISSRTDCKQFATDIILAVSKFLELELNKKQIYSLHASAIACGGKGIIIIGQSGAGKTTTAIDSCFKNKRISLVSGSRVFVKDEKIVGSIVSMDVRRGSIYTDFNKNLNKNNSNLLESNNQNNNLLWEERILLSPKDCEIGLNTNYPLDIHEFILVKRIEKSLSIIKDEISRDSFLARIYDSLFAFSEQIPWYILGSKIAYPDLFGDKMRKDRVAFGDALLGSKPYLYLEGRLDDISKYIIENVDKNRLETK